MPRRFFAKDDIELRYERDTNYYAPVPTINVKVYNFPSVDKIAEHFKCSDEQAERACELAFESAQQSFWEGIEELAEHHLGKGVKVWQAGRRGGWLIVKGLPDVESWDAIRVSAWARFEEAVKKDIAYRTSLETFIEDIEANQWTLEGAELYNFVDTASGIKTVPELKAHVAKARADFLNS